MVASLLTGQIPEQSGHLLKFRGLQSEAIS
jgi:hypothetical protein